MNNQKGHLSREGKRWSILPKPPSNSNSKPRRISLLNNQNHRASVVGTTSRSATPLHQNKAGQLFRFDDQERLADSRPLKDRDYQRSLISNIIHYLREVGPELKLTSIIDADLRSPTFNTFSKIFKALYNRCIDTEYSFSSNLSDEFTELLLAVGYPYYSSIPPKCLLNVGSYANWPPLLGLLDWLVQMAKSSERFGLPVKDLEQGQEAYDFIREQVLDNYNLDKANTEEVALRQREAFEEENALIIQDTQELEKALEERQAEIQNLGSIEEKLEEYHVKIKEKEQAIAKMVDYEGKLKASNEKYKGRIEKGEEYIQHLVLHEAELQSELASKEAMVLELRIDQKQLDELNSSLDQIARANYQTQQIISGKKDTCKHLELDLEKASSKLDRNIQTLNQKLTALNEAHPNRAPLPLLTLDLTGDSVQTCLPVDFTTVILPRLYDLTNEIKADNINLITKLLALDNEKEEVQQQINKVEATIEKLQQEANQLDSQNTRATNELRVHDSQTQEIIKQLDYSINTFVDEHETNFHQQEAIRFKKQQNLELVKNHGEMKIKENEWQTNRFKRKMNEFESYAMNKINSMAKVFEQSHALLTSGDLEKSPPPSPEKNH